MELVLCHSLRRDELLQVMVPLRTVHIFIEEVQRQYFRVRVLLLSLRQPLFEFVAMHIRGTLLLRPAATRSHNEGPSATRSVHHLGQMKVGSSRLHVGRRNRLSILYNADIRRVLNSTAMDVDRTCRLRHSRHLIITLLV